MSSPAPHVGTLRESPLHASLKQWCSQPGDRMEVPVDGFVIDLVRGDQLIEIQTRSFSSMKRKLPKLLAAGHRVRVVHPIAVDKWLVKVDEHGAELDRRRSPKHGSAVDLFSELVSFPGLLGVDGLEIEVVLIEAEEYRHHDPAKAWRRKGWVVDERRLVRVLDSILIAGPSDLLGLLPQGLEERFTTAHLAAGLGRPRRLAQQMAYCLRNAGVIQEVGRVGRAVEYSVGSPTLEGTSARGQRQPDVVRGKGQL